MITEIILPPFFAELINNNVEVTVHKSDKYCCGYYFDLHLEAKSGMHLYKLNELWRVAMRYGDDYVVNSLPELIYCAKLGMHGRDFIHPAWASLISKQK